MADIHVARTPEPGTYLVTVRDEKSETRHRVTVSDSDYERLGGGYGSREGFLEACFEFLLGREPKEAILSRFDVSAISRYFPEFEEKIRRT